MTTKHKIMASIWVPIVSVYLLIVIGYSSITGRGLSNIWDHFLGVFQLFLFGAFFWVPILIICLIIENNWTKNEIKHDTIRKILMVEAIICSIPIWFLIVKIPTQLGILIVFNLIILLSIAARWGYLKWRKIC